MYRHMGPSEKSAPVLSFWRRHHRRLLHCLDSPDLRIICLLLCLLPPDSPRSTCLLPRFGRSHCSDRWVIAFVFVRSKSALRRGPSSGPDRRSHLAGHRGCARPSGRRSGTMGASRSRAATTLTPRWPPPASGRRRRIWPASPSRCNARSVASRRWSCPPRP